jgi:hypothetical protein
MNTLTLEPPSVGIQDIKVTSSALTIELSDGRSISAPLVWYPRLLNASSKERNNWELIGEGHGIHWPDLDEDLSMEGITQGRPSYESQKSFQRWLAERKKKGLTGKGLLRAKPRKQSVVEQARSGGRGHSA